jgi:hypothetical protein
MMGGGRFILLKAGRRGAESAQQAEVRLADLLKILRICRGAAKPARRRRNPHAMVVRLRISARYG